MEVQLTLDLKWWGFDQNNSGGRFDVGPDVAHYVLVQARSAQEAVARFKPIADRTNSGNCACCGPRWGLYVDDEDYGTDEPMIYGEPVREVEATFFRKEVRLHHFDGRVESVTLKAKAGAQ